MPERPGADDAWWPSRVHHAWIARYIIKGWSKPLQHEDMPDPPKSIRAEPTLFKNAQASWERELAGKRKGGPSLVRSVWWTSAKGMWLVGSVFAVVSGLTTTVGRPLMLRWTLLALDPASDYSQSEGLGFAAGLVVMMWLEGWTKVIAIHKMGAEAPSCIMPATMHLLGLKAVSLATGKGKAGAETALVGNDCIRSAQMLLLLPILIMGVASLIGGIWSAPRRSLARAFRYCCSPRVLLQPADARARLPLPAQLPPDRRRWRGGPHRARHDGEWLLPCCY